ncbi:hypothetical protein [Modestobacter sp. SYSU DS0657]
MTVIMEGSVARVGRVTVLQEDAVPVSRDRSSSVRRPTAPPRRAPRAPDLPPPQPEPGETVGPGEAAEGRAPHG